MGWARTLLLGDIGNRLDIEDTERDIESIRSSLRRSTVKTKRQEEMIQILIDENAELKLYLASTIRLLKSKNIISGEELIRMVDKIDLEDGVQDGKQSQRGMST